MDRYKATIHRGIAFVLTVLLLASPFSVSAAVYSPKLSEKKSERIREKNPNINTETKHTITNDTYRDMAWAVNNKGQIINDRVGTIGADMDIDAAWDITEGSATIIVAVIDTGVDYTHPDLVQNMWDGSQCVDDRGVPIPRGCLHGYDFENNDPDPMTTNFHGTHVAGTIAATKNNAIGIAGVAPQTKIMALRFAQDVESEVRAINFARENGATIINASFTRTTFSIAEYTAIKKFLDAGGIFVTAASNDHTDNDHIPHYPASYDLPGIISVAATDQSDHLASFSNFGRTSVDIAAPGVNIASLLPDGKYGFADGTSMAAPHVAGVVALVWAVHPHINASQVKALILHTGDTIPELIPLTVSGKRINAYRAVTAVLSSTQAPLFI